VELVKQCPSVNKRSTFGPEQTKKEEKTAQKILAGLPLLQVEKTERNEAQ